MAKWVRDSEAFITIDPVAKTTTVEIHDRDGYRKEVRPMKEIERKPKPKK